MVGWSMAEPFIKISATWQRFYGGYVIVREGIAVIVSSWALSTPPLSNSIVAAPDCVFCVQAPTFAKRGWLWRTRCCCSEGPSPRTSHLAHVRLPFTNPLTQSRHCWPSHQIWKLRPVFVSWVIMRTLLFSVLSFPFVAVWFDLIRRIRSWDYMTGLKLKFACNGCWVRRHHPV